MEWLNKVTEFLNNQNKINVITERQIKALEARVAKLESLRPTLDEPDTAVLTCNKCGKEMDKLCQKCWDY
ncbi:MAG: hypothetical protein MJA29_02340 [Candidatus Omnitrophica bacterium]|nr:hypothetical protein [Candidatus Omnitrophota bacterium]